MTWLIFCHVSSPDAVAVQNQPSDDQRTAGQRNAMGKTLPLAYL